MGKYRLSSIKIRMAKNGNKYVKVKIQNIDDPNAKIDDYYFFSEGAVRCYEPYLSFVNGGISNFDKQIPEQYLIIYGEYCDFRPGYKFFKKHLKDDLNNNIHKGDYVRDSNRKVKVYDTLTVFCRYYIESGEKIYGKLSPKEVGQREFRRCCVIYSLDLERKLNNLSELNYVSDNNLVSDDEFSSSYYNDSIDMDQQSQKYWEDLGIF